MFENYYHFQKVRVQQANGKRYIKSLTTYTFKSEKNSYIAEAEHYQGNIYILKYYLKQHRHNKKRFNLMANEYKCSQTVSTCIHIMLSLLKKNPSANFGFMGAHTIDLAKGYEEKRANTRRFKIYRHAMEQMIGPDYFEHFMNEENSTYLMVNLKEPDVQRVSDFADKMFIECYPELQGI